MEYNIITGADGTGKETVPLGTYEIVSITHPSGRYAFCKPDEAQTYTTDYLDYDERVFSGEGVKFKYLLCDYGEAESQRGEMSYGMEQAFNDIRDYFWLIFMWLFVFFILAIFIKIYRFMKS
jgi:hypothetical protein